MEERTPREALPRLRLSDFLRSQQAAITATWVDRVRSLAPARELSTRAIVNHLPLLLERLADAIERGPASTAALRGGEARHHAVDRLTRGFNLSELIEEYGLLRRVLFELWERAAGPAASISDLRELDSALDEAVAEGAVSYTEARARMLEALDRISAAALGAANLDAFLDELLQVALSSTDSADCAVFFLRQGDDLVVRASAGFDCKLDLGTAFRLDQGVPARVVEEGRPLSLDPVDGDPLVSPALQRATGVHTFYGVPLWHRGKVVGAAYIGSRKAYEFSDEEKLLFRSMTNRATDALIQSRFIADLQRAAEAAEFLSNASRLLAASLDVERTVAAVTQAAVPRLGDWCTVDLLEDGQIRLVSVAHSDPAKAEQARELRARYPLMPDAPQGVAQVLRTGQAELFERFSEAQLPTQEIAYLTAMRRMGGLRSVLIAPLSLGDRVLGALTLAWAETPRHYTPADLALAEELARRAAMALDNARLLRESQRSVRIREDVLAIVSHDLRNPLSALSMSAALLNRRLTDLDPRDRDLINTIQRSATRMDRLIDDLLDMASVEAQRLRLSLRPTDLAPLLAEAYRGFAHQAEEHGIALVCDVQAPSGLVCCDSDRVRQVLSNLLGNAVKFSPAGATITLRATRQAGEVVVEVADTGPGIPPDQVPHVFEQYWRAKRSEKGGIGLGLFIAKGIVEAQGGRLWLDTEVGRGTRVFFSLPEVPTAPAAS